jgi:hypothetical protein
MVGLRLSGLCAAALQVLDSLAEARYDSSIAIVVYHPFDQFKIHPADTLRLRGFDYYQPPALVLDRRQIELPSWVSDSQYTQALEDAIDSLLPDSTYTTIELAGEADSASGMLAVRVTVDSAPPDADLRLKCVITEDSAADSIGLRYDRVARRFMPSIEGKAFSLARTDTLWDTLRFSCAGWRPRELSAVAFVEDARTGKVVQSAELRRFAEPARRKSCLVK